MRVYSLRRKWFTAVCVARWPEGVLEVRHHPTVAKKTVTSQCNEGEAICHFGWWELSRSSPGSDSCNSDATCDFDDTVKRPKLTASTLWTHATLHEIMTFFGILIYFLLYLQSGRRIRDTQESPYHNAWTKFMEPHPQGPRAFRGPSKCQPCRSDDE